jgi:hypothetical protein
MLLGRKDTNKTNRRCLPEAPLCLEDEKGCKLYVTAVSEHVSAYMCMSLISRAIRPIGSGIRRHHPKKTPFGRPITIYSNKE